MPVGLELGPADLRGASEILIAVVFQPPVARGPKLELPGQSELEVAIGALDEQAVVVAELPVLLLLLLFLLPGRGVVDISRRITNKAERRRLTRLVAEAAEAGDGFTLRSAAAAAADAIIRDMAELHDAWGGRRQQASPPACLWRAPDPRVRSRISRHSSSGTCPKSW